MEILKAHEQWKNRPADETFQTLDALYEATHHYYETAQEKTVPYSDVRVEAEGSDVFLTGKVRVPARFTNWAFGQLCTKVGAPASYLRELPATLAAQNLNHGLAQRGNGTNANLLFHANSGLLLRSITSEKYARIWNYEVCERLRALGSIGWAPAMPDWNKSDEDHPALYASDHDMFAFLCNPNNRIAEPGNPDGLKKGVIVSNSEVGASSFYMMRFYYRGMCGNHIIWSASNVIDIRVRHVGDARRRADVFQAEVRKFANESATETEAKIIQARSVKLGDDKQAVLNALFGKLRLDVPMKTLEASYDAVNREQDGDPNTVWGYVQGMTRHSQTVPYADARTKLDRAAGRIMEAAF